MNILKRAKKLEKYRNEMNIINKCAIDIKELMKETTSFVNKFIDIEKRLEAIDKNNKDDMTSALILEHEIVVNDSKKIIESAKKYGINKFGLWLRRKRIDKVLLYISVYCKKNIKYLLKKQEKITKIVTSW